MDEQERWEAIERMESELSIWGDTNKLSVRARVRVKLSGKLMCIRSELGVR